MKTKKKLNKVTVAVLAVLCCVVFSISAKAFDAYEDYAIGPNGKYDFKSFVTGTNKIYLYTRPSEGGSITITLGGAASGSHGFPTQVIIPKWEVKTNPSKTLYIKGTAGESGCSGSLHKWSDD